MANKHHLAIIKQGVEAWNKWREENREIRPELYGEHLSGANLSGANFSDTDLHDVYLSDANLVKANFIGANLRRAMLSGSDLSNADLSSAILDEANLSDTDLIRVNLNHAIFSKANLQNADLSNATIYATIFTDIDLSATKGLDSVRHNGPSEISISTLYSSGGNIPEAFLRGCGVPDDFINYVRSLIGKAIEIVIVQRRIPVYHSRQW